MARKIYHITSGDHRIFRRFREENDPTWITNYYMRSPYSGTWWRHVRDETIERLTLKESRAAATVWQTGYNTLFDIWKHLKKPDYFGPDPDNLEHWDALTEEVYDQRYNSLQKVYRCRWEQEKYPAFHHPHGIMLLPWQLELWRATQPITINVGGFGSSKTWAKLFCMLVNAITLPGYRGFILAPYSNQSEEAYKQALLMIQGTRFEQFLVSKPRRPRPTLNFNNDLTGPTSIECYSVLDDPGKILTLSGDEVMIDQAEQLLDLDTVIRDAGTRLRGTVRGRPRIGKISLLANSADNQQLWDWVDEGISDPESVWAYSPTTFENTHLTIADLIRFERQVGRDESSKRMYLLGKRPLGGGIHFPKESLALCKSDYLDSVMAEGLRKRQKGYVLKERPKVHIHEWQLPPEDDHNYLLAADPGWADPPYRNSPALAVWDITSFPRTPASMRAFAWVYGNNSPNPWIAKYMELLVIYKCFAYNGFDSTGQQSGYERLTELGEVHPTPVALAGTKKYIYLNLTKKIMADGLFQIPSIQHIFSQCASYTLPDNNLRQDLVSMLLVTAALLEPLYYIHEPTAEEEAEFRRMRYNEQYRYSRPNRDRYTLSRGMTERKAR